MTKERKILPTSRRLGVFIGRLFLVGVVIMFIGMLVYAQSRISRLQMDIRELKTEISEEEDEQSRLQEQIDKNSDLSRIMSRAAELGMGYPDEDSVIYLETDESSTSLRETQP